MEFVADFANNVAAVAVVLLFAKLVTHRSRKLRAEDDPRIWILFAVHVVAVVAAAAAVVLSLAAVYRKCDALGDVAWWAAAVAGVILIIDVLIEDMRDAARQAKRPAGAKTTRRPLLMKRS
ncbi:MAG: hypothetical protein JWR11_6063 [Mycobacterium sp.]|jgi:tellurite resistance protein TehA-like permease|nr:hypothetical protein [Mycobacterium sp.]MDT5064126.1 hypothetical protein [Mycobacterium sp.]